MLCWALLLTVFASPEVNTTQPINDLGLAQKISAFLNDTTNILRNNHDLVEYVVTLQVDSVINNVDATAIALHNQKFHLRQAIAAGGLSTQDGDRKFDALTGTINKLTAELEKFSGEISANSDLTSGRLQETTDEGLYMKIHRIRDARKAWDAGNTKVALAALDDAIAQTDQLDKAAKCLLDTVKAKKPTCNANTLEPIH